MHTGILERKVTSVTALARRVFKQASVVLCIMAFTAFPGHAQNSDVKRRDVVVMKNGDQLTGEVKKLERGQLFIETVYAVDPIPVDWLQVDRLESTAQYQIELDEGRRLVGTIAKSTPADATESDFRLQGAVSETRLKALDVVGIQSQKNSFWRQLKGSIDFGLGLNSGSDQSQGNLSASVSYPSTRFRVDNSLTSSITSTGDLGKTNRHEITSTSQIYLSRRAFIGSVADFLTSSQQSLDLRTTLGGGYGRFLIRTNRTNLTWLAGVVYTNEKYDPNSGLTPRQNNVEGLLSIGLDWFRFDTAAIQTTWQLFPSMSDAGRVRSSLNTSFSIKFAHSLYLKFSLYDTYDSKPPVNAQKNELGASSSFGWTF